MPKDEKEIEVGIQKRSFERGILGNGSNPEARFIGDYSILEKYVEALRTLELSIVLTSGTFDLPHIGHARYLEEAKSYGDVLIVGVDSDEKVRKRKGPERPVVPENERVDMLAHLRHVNVITLKQEDDERWELIRRVAPDTLIITKETYDEETKDELRKICGQVICLEPQATTSTSAQIRRLQVGWSSKITNPIEQVLEEHHASPELRIAIGKIITGRKDD
ncbi:MAG: adenylyltransferase/cytidyltransferase family protein [Candidatus Saccharibacteria bacterium]